MLKKILVTGGCGYIGSHTIVDLVQHGYTVISVDDFSRSNPEMLEGIQKITGTQVKNYAVNLCDASQTENIFIENPDIEGIIHFAAFKAVGESVQQPLMYFQNNINSLLNVLACCEKYKVNHFVFSSSCTVYGDPEQSPVTETTPLKPATSPYGYTKQIGEEMIRQFIPVSNLQSILLRYFNPVGAHPSAEIGELPIGTPANLVPAITQTATGKLPQMKVNGSDYPTSDGSCVRDYIHVCDIANAHTLALDYLLQQKNNNPCEVFNLGTGNGYTVLEVIHAFEKVTGEKLNYMVGDRRPGDVVSIFANNEKARTVLGWNPRYQLEEMMQTAWQWECKLKNSN
jgi:UDP-glucose 4-epimerase